jgi:DNA-binding LytR/AlgR family response regulator
MKTNIKCLIIEDEPLAAEVLENYLLKFDNVSFEKTTDPVKAIQLISYQKFDLLFLDIETPLLTGIEFLKNRKDLPPVIITTAYSEYALEGYEYEVVDYLIKPFSFTRFMIAFERAMKRITREKGLEEISGKEYHDFMFFKIDRKLVKIYLKDILYIESLKDYIRINTATGSYISYQTLSSVTSDLPADNFMRIHRSCTIATDKIDMIDGNCVVIGGKYLPISREKKFELSNYLLGK